MKQEFLMLAHTFDPQSDNVANWYWSEKLDGMRAFWDGGISRGLLKSEVPWANIAKDGRYKNREYATGLWTRYGHVIHAPDTWLDKLPRIPLDGELYMGRGTHQDLLSIAKTLEPGFGWSKIKLHCFDCPSLRTVFDDRIIDTVQYKKVFKNIMAFILERQKLVHFLGCENQIFRSVYDTLGIHLHNNQVAVRHTQYLLPDDPYEYIEKKVAEISLAGGEGMILRAPHSMWYPERLHSLLKVKKVKDDEATIVGYIAGRGKLQGKVGAFIMDYNGKRFELAGSSFNEEEIRIDCNETLTAGIEIPDHISAVHFPRGTKVTFVYRELTRDGIPKEARYWRKYST